MTRLILPQCLGLSFCALMLAAAPAAAQGCYADYKAKQDNPLKLHYGVAQISGQCAPGPAAQELGPRLQAQGWTLLNVVSVFGSDGLEGKKANAGVYFLRF